MLKSWSLSSTVAAVCGDGIQHIHTYQLLPRTRDVIQHHHIIPHRPLHIYVSVAIIAEGASFARIKHPCGVCRVGEGMTGQDGGAVHEEGPESPQTDGVPEPPR